MTEIELPRHIGLCHLRDQGEAHPPHSVDIAHCEHEIDTWCYGIPEPGSLEAAIEGLQPGQRVRVVWEGVVDDPHVCHGHQGIVRDPVALKTGKDGYLVLRYTGALPFPSDATALKVAGQHNSGVVSIEVLPDVPAPAEG